MEIRTVELRKLLGSLRRALGCQVGLIWPRRPRGSRLEAALGALLGRFWWLLAALGALLGRFWWLLAALGAVLKPLEPLLGRPGPLLCASGWSFWDLPGADLDVLDGFCGVT